MTRAWWRTGWCATGKGHVNAAHVYAREGGAAQTALARHSSATTTATPPTGNVSAASAFAKMASSAIRVHVCAVLAHGHPHARLMLTDVAAGRSDDKCPVDLSLSSEACGGPLRGTCSMTAGECGKVWTRTSVSSGGTTHILFSHKQCACFETYGGDACGCIKAECPHNSAGECSGHGVWWLNTDCSYTRKALKSCN